MVNSLVPLLVGFLLTTVLGGILGYYFQSRSWHHQNAAKVLETELQTALKVFEDISKLMDKRVYRMRLLFWRLSGQDTKEDTIENAINLYREVLYDWNDNLNRNLALIQCYFGDDIRKQIDYKVYERFKDIGNLLEEAYLLQKQGKKSNDLERVRDNIENLSHEIYYLNIQIIKIIQSRNVGIYHKDKKETQPKQTLKKA